MKRGVTEIFAPGKLMIFGEYGVLRGGRALLAGVSRGVTLCIEPYDAPDRCLYRVPALGDPLELRLDDENARPIPADSPLWPMLEQVLQHTGGAAPLLGHTLTADLSEMTLEIDGRMDKLGLGSSAASCVALTAASMLLQNQQPTADTVLEPAFDAHHAFQGGRGSGADVATSALGNTVAFHLEAKRPVARPAAALLPPWKAFWTGQSANTRTFIDAIRRLEARDPERFQQLMRRIQDTAGTGVDAAIAGDVSVFLTAIHKSADHLRLLGEAANVSIVTTQHELLASSASAHGFVSKPSGAGGGDFSLVFGEDGQALDRWTTALDIPGIQHVPLSTSPGVHVREG